MWKKKIKRNKLQYVLIGIVIAASIGIFSMCLSFVAEFSTFSQGVMTEDNSSDAYTLGFGTNDLKGNITDDDVVDNIKDIVKYEGKRVLAPILYKDDDVSMMYQIMLPVDNIDDLQEFQTIEATYMEKGPRKGEIWISELLSSSSDIQLGDTLTLKYDSPIDFKISGIYSANFLVTANFPFAPLLMNEKDVADIESEIATLFAVNLTDDSAEKVSELGDAFKYSVLTASRAELMENFMIVAGPVGSFGTIAALIVFFVALSMISYIVKATILREYKTIAVYKSLGYSYKDIKRVYTKGYMMVGLVMSIIGILISLPIIKKLGVISSQYATGFELTQVTYTMSVASLILFMILLKVYLNKALKPIKRKTVLEIMSMGQGIGKRRKLPRTFIKGAITPFQTAINDVFKHRGVTSRIIIAFVLSTYLSLLFTMIAYSSNVMDENKNLWFGVPKADTYAMGNINKDFIEKLDKNNTIDYYTYGTIIHPAKIETSDSVKLGGMNIDVFNDRSPEKTGIIIKGEVPIENDEIAATGEALQLLDAQVGDGVNLKVNDIEKTYTITGSYATQLNNLGIMMSIDAMKEIDENYVPYTAFINLKSGNDFDRFKSDTEDKFTGVTISESWFAIDNAMASIKTMLFTVSAIMIGVFIIFAILNMLVILMMENNNRHKRYGIMKALGFTTGYIIKQNMYKTIIYVTVSTVIAWMMHLTISREFLARQVIDAFMNSYTLNIILTTGLFVLALIVVFAISLNVKKISTIGLMEE